MASATKDASTLIYSTIESHDALSANFLALKLNVSIDSSRSLLDKYASEGKVRKEVVVSGIEKDTGSLCFSIEDIDNVNSLSLQDVTVETYCIGKIGMTNALQAAQLSEDKLVHHLLTAGDGALFNDSFGGIKLRNLEVKPNGERVSTAPSNRYSDEVELAEEAAKHIAKTFPTKQTIVPKSKSSIEATNFFAKSESNDPKTKSSNEKVENIHSSSKPPPPLPAATNTQMEKSKHAPTVASENDDEAEWEDEQPKKKKLQTEMKNQNQSKIDHSALAETPVDNNTIQKDVEEEEDDEEEEEGNAEVQQPKKRKARKRKEVLHGAMDDFIADKEDGDNGTMDTQVGKKKKTKLVEKVFLFLFIYQNFL